MRSMVRDVLRALTRVTARRMRRGPAAPGWSVAYETAIEVLRRIWNSGDDLETRRRWLDRGGGGVRVRGVRTEGGRLGDRPVEWLISEGSTDDSPVWLYLHGGGYEVCSPRTHRSLTRPLARLIRGRLVAPDYRLAPEHPCPAAIEDAVAAYRALLDQGIDPSRIAIGGDSAGGGLTVATLCALRDAGEPLPATAVLLSPWVDLARVPEPAPLDYLQPTLHPGPALGYAGDLPLDDPRVSPIHADLSGLPPTLILAGGAELLLPDSLELTERMRAAGVEVELDVEPDEIHVYPLFGPVNPRARTANRRMAAWVTRRTGS